MKDIAIGIIGGTGGMGGWFARFFQEQGYPVLVSGRERGVDIPTMAEACQVVIVSVPISITCEVIEHVGPHMKEETLLMDLTSLKAEPVKSMLRFSPSEVIGLHPLFGPAVNSITGHKIAICPVRTKKWLVWLKDLLIKHGATIIETTPERHDKLMAFVQALNHLNTITMGIMVKESGVDFIELQRFATPMLTTKLGFIEEVCVNNPRLYAEIIALNPNMDRILDLYEKTVSYLKDIIKTKDTVTLMETIKGGGLRES